MKNPRLRLGGFFKIQPTQAALNDRIPPTEVVDGESEMSDQKRRDFLKIAAAGIVAPAILPELTFGANDSNQHSAEQRTQKRPVKAPRSEEHTSELQSR